MSERFFKAVRFYSDFAGDELFTMLRIAQVADDTGIVSEKELGEPPALRFGRASVLNALAGACGFGGVIKVENASLAKSKTQKQTIFIMVLNEDERLSVCRCLNPSSVSVGEAQARLRFRNIFISHKSTSTCIANSFGPPNWKIAIQTMIAKLRPGETLRVGDEDPALEAECHGEPMFLRRIANGAVEVRLGESGPWIEEDFSGGYGDEHP